MPGEYYACIITDIAFPGRAIVFGTWRGDILAASADNPPGAGKLSSLLVQLLTRVLFGPPIPQVAAMEQKCIARSKIFM
jgi:hypothetical protein